MLAKKLLDTLFKPFAIFVVFTGVAMLNAATPIIEEDVTRAEPLDLSVWMSNDVEANPLLVGKWDTETLGVIQISTTPVAKNTYFVQTEERIVPCFQIDVKDQHYIVIGTHASEDLELIPQVYRYSISGDEDLVEMQKLEANQMDGAFRNVDAFIQFVSSETIEDLLIPVQFKRI